MYHDWPARAASLSGPLKELRAGTPEVMNAFSGLAREALKPGALDPKTKELVALAIGVAIRCDDCVAFHAKAAAQQGATREEVMEVLGTVIYMGAGPSVMYSSHAVEAYDQFTAASATP